MNKKPYVPLTEEEDWEKWDCKDNQEWRDHLNEAIWAGYTPKLKEK